MKVELRRLKAQAELIDDETSKHLALIGGVGSGKTHGGALKALRLGLVNSPCDGLWVEPTFRLVHDVAYPMLRNLFDTVGLPYRWVKSDQEFHVGGTAPFVLKLRSGDVPERMVGLTVGWAIIDEPGIQDVLVADGVDKRVRDKRAKVPQRVYVGTPEGFGWLYDWFVAKPLPGSRLINARTKDNPHNSEGYYEGLLARLTEGEAQQYLEGGFVARKGRVYVRFDRQKHDRICANPLAGTVFIGADFNLNPLVWVFGRRLGHELHIWGEIMAEYSDTISVCGKAIDYLEEMHREHRSTLSRREIAASTEIIPDASCNQRRTASDGTASDLDHMIKAGFDVRRPSHNPPIRDRVFSVNLAFHENRLFVDVKRCPQLVGCLEQQPWNHRTNEPDKAGGLDHACFVAGTQVMTDHGEVAIENIQAGDMVLTRAGLRPVVTAGMTSPDAPVMHLPLSNGRTLRATANHPIYVDRRGFIRMDAIGYTDRLLACPTSTSSCSTESPTGATPTRPDMSRAGTSHPEEPSASKGGVDSTKKSGWLSTEPSPLVSTSTTSTETHSTTTSATSRLSTLESMPSGTRAGRAPSARPLLGLDVRTRHAHGMAPLRGSPSTPSSATSQEAAFGPSSTSVHAVASTSSPPPSTPASRSSAHATAKPRGEGYPASMTSTAPARSAAPPSESTGTSSSDFALELVALLEAPRSSGRAAVYNLTVDGEHEFFADGVLVHNCDALGYPVHFYEPAHAPRGNQSHLSRRP